MTPAELKRYNLQRLVKRDGREPLAIALAAWPLPDGLDSRECYLATEVRRKKLDRALRGPTRITDASLLALAIALGVQLSEFLREPVN